MQNIDKKFTVRAVCKSTNQYVYGSLIQQADGSKQVFCYDRNGDSGTVKVYPDMIDRYLGYIEPVKSNKFIKFIKFFAESWTGDYNIYEGDVYELVVSARPSFKPIVGRGFFDTSTFDNFIKKYPVFR